MKEAPAACPAKLTPRERVRRLLRRERVDSIPNGLGGCETAGLHNLAYDTLKRALGVTDRANRMCTFMNNAVFEPPVLRAVDGDIILLGSRMCPSPLWGDDAGCHWKDLRIWDMDIQVPAAWCFRQDPDGTWWWDDWAKCPPGALYFDPVPGASGLSLYAEYPSPDGFSPSHELPEGLLTGLQQQARFLYETTGYAIACGEMIHDLQLQPGGHVSWWMRMVEEPQACHEFLGKACDAALAHIKQLDQAIGQYCDILGIAHDLGDSRGVTIGPDLWREIYLPHYRRLFTEWHSLTDMKVNLHTCGAVSEILGDLIDCGVDIYNPVQISARGMDPSGLKKRFGDKVIFYGGVYDAVLQMPLSADEVYEQVTSNIRTFSRGGGYLFAGVHNLPGDIPEDHLQALLSAWRDCRCEADLLGPS